MAHVSVPRTRIMNGSLPPHCVVCGRAASHRSFPGVRAPSQKWLVLSSVIGLLTFWSHFVFSGGKSTTRGFPFCERHRGYWPRRGWFIIVGLIVTVVLLAAGGALLATGTAGRPDRLRWLYGVIGSWLVAFLPTLVILHLGATRAVGGNTNVVVLMGASNEFAVAVHGRKKKGAAPPDKPRHWAPEDSDEPAEQSGA
jgi:hypothetical protein